MEDIDDLELEDLSDDELDDPAAGQNGNGNDNPSKKLSPKVIGAFKQQKQRIKDLKAELANRPPVATPAPVVVTPPQNGGQDSNDVQKLVFAQQNRNLDFDDVENVFAIAAMKKISHADALNDPLFVAYKEKKDASRKVQDATPTPSNRSSVQPPQGKAMKDLTDAERREMQDKIIAEKRKNR